MLYRYFLFISMMLYAAGFSFQFYIGEYSLDDAQVRMHLFAWMLFLSGYLLGGFVLLPFAHRPVQITTGKVSQALIEKGQVMVNWLGIIACLFAIYYVLDGGYKKLLLLGSDIDALDFRFIGLDDRPAYLAIPMELSRRIVLPFAILGKFSLNRFSNNPDRKLLTIFLVVFAVVSVINLDRGPILMFIVLITYQILSVTRSLLLKAIVGVVAVAAIGFAGAFFSFLQYNNLNFGFQDLVDTLYGILVNRIILSPVKMAQVWVFDNWAEFIHPLYFAYSRVSVLWGGDYVGSREAVSYLVAPVGIVGDIYRNLGMEAQFLVGFLLGMVFLFVERQLRAVPPIVQTPLNFVSLILAMYLYYGNIFSLGPFAILVVLLLAPVAFSMVFNTNKGINSQKGLQPGFS